MGLPGGGTTFPAQTVQNEHHRGGPNPAWEWVFPLFSVRSAEKKIETQKNEMGGVGGFRPNHGGGGSSRVGTPPEVGFSIFGEKWVQKGPKVGLDPQKWVRTPLPQLV